MGYTTTFTGRFQLDRPLKTEQVAYLRAFGNTRRMKRNPELASAMADPLRLAVGLPIGCDAADFVGGLGDLGQERDPSILDYNTPPSGQPGLWCNWVPCQDDSITWNRMEKYYKSDKWLEYLIRRFLQPWGYVLNGEVTWCGEEFPDMGVIRVDHNQVGSTVIEDS
jgi:hypothetical protein